MWRWVVGALTGSLLVAACTTDRPEPRETETTATPSVRVPLALVVPLDSDQPDMTVAEARALVDRGRSGVEVLDGDGPNATAIVQQVSRSRDVVGFVPATAIRPTVRALRIDGKHPVLDAATYPLTTSAPSRPGAVLTTSIVGDVMLGRRVATTPGQRADPTRVWRPWERSLAAADLSVINLEGTLSRAGAPRQGGDSFAADPEVLAGLKDAGIDVVGVANNHLGDFGDEALRRTLSRLKAAGFPTVGAGANLDEARRPVVVERDGVRFGFIATDSIGETPAATGSSPGTNRVNAPPRTGAYDTAAVARVARDVTALSKRADVVIVLPHWGTQYVHTPEASQRRMARTWAQSGADLVVGGHPHWVQGWELFGRTPVVHSLGNFIFDMDFQRKTNEGIVLEVVTWGGDVVMLTPRPYVIGDDFAPRPVDGDRARSILRDIRDSSRPPFDRIR